MHCVEPYFKINLPRNERSLLSQLQNIRYGILQIQLETGRYKGEVRADRYCRICNGGVVKDQYHFVLKCPVITLHDELYLLKRFKRR